MSKPSAAVQRKRRKTRRRRPLLAKPDCHDWPVFFLLHEQDRIKARAKANHRSPGGEVMAVFDAIEAIEKEQGDG